MTDPADPALAPQLDFAGSRCQQCGLFAPWYAPADGIHHGCGGIVVNLYATAGALAPRPEARLHEELAHWRLHARAMARAADTEKAEARYWRDQVGAIEARLRAVVAEMKRYNTWAENSHMPGYETAFIDDQIEGWTKEIDAILRPAAGDT